MSVIDQRIVEMKFDNKHFESNVATSMSTLSKLKNSLNLTGAAKGFENVGTAASRINMNPLSSAVETVRLKFSALEIMAITALTNITNSVINAGKTFVSALTIDPVKMGFKEYETQINAIQTILANTSAKGTNLEQVTKALDELNLYADRTIYNFTEMTRNIGTFTAAGIDLDTSVSAIKGIANLAAVSGSTSQQASTGMYQLSQALSTGTVRLMDWNSVVNAGMGGEVFQKALKDTARIMGTNVDEIIEKEGSFRASLVTGWLSKDVLTNTLAKFTGDMSKEQIRAIGYTEEQTEAIYKMSITANDAATKVKTFTQLFDTLKEAAQSGWTKSWEHIIGDFNEAKTLLTEISDIFGAIIGKSADSRNALLSGWKDLGGRDDLINSFRNIVSSVTSIVTPIKEAFSEIFPPTTAQQLRNITEAISKFTAKLTLSDENSDRLKRTAKGLFAVLDIVRIAISEVIKVIMPMTSYVDDVGSGILALTASWGDWLVGVRDFIKENDIFAIAMGYVKDVLKSIVAELKIFVEYIQPAIEKMKAFLEQVKQLAIALAEKIKSFGLEMIHDFLERMHKRMVLVGEVSGTMKSSVVTAIEIMAAAFKNSRMMEFLDGLWNGIRNIASGLGDFIKSIFPALGESLVGGNFDSVLDVFNAFSLGAIAIAIRKFADNLFSPMSELKGSLAGIVGILDSVKDTLVAYQTKLKADALTKLAIAIAILAGAILLISLIDSAKVTSSLAAITMLVTELMIAMSITTKTFKGTKSVIKNIALMLALTTSILLLSVALKSLSSLSVTEMTVGLVGIASLMTMMVLVLNTMPKNTKKVLSGATNMVIFAAAIKVLAGVVKELSALSWEELAKGLAGVGALLAAVSVFLNTAKFSKRATSTAAGMVILAAALKIMATVVKDFAEMKWEELGKGLAAITGVLLAVALFTNLTGDAKRVLATSASLIIIAEAMKIFAVSVKSFSDMSWEEIGRGMAAFAGSLIAVAIATNLMPKNMIFIGTGLLAVAAAMKILSEVLNSFAGMTWDEIGQGLAVLATSLFIFAVGLNMMRGTLLASAALVVAVSALALLTPVLAVLGAMSWDSIIKGLTTIAGAFVILGLAGLALTPVLPTLLGLSAVFVLVGVGVLAIGAGLTAAGAGLASVAIGLVAVGGSLAAAATSIVAAVTVIATGIIGLIPAIIVALGKGLTEVVLVVMRLAPLLVRAVGVFANSILDEFMTLVPKLVTGILSLVTHLLDAIVEYTPRIVDSLLSFIILIIKGLAARMPELIQAGVDLVMSLFSGIIKALEGIDANILIKAVAGVGLLSAMMLALSLVVGLIPGAMLGVLGMGAVVAEMAIVLALIGSLAQIPGLKWLVGEGGSFLESIGSAIGGFFGGLVGGLLGGVVGKLPKLGDDLAKFMKNVNPFVDGLKKIDSTAMDGVKILSETIMILTGTNLMNKLSSWLTGGTSIVEFGEELAEFGPHFRKYYNSVKNINAEVIHASANAAKALGEMATNLPNQGGVVSWFKGENRLSIFAEELAIFGPKLKAYADSVDGLNSSAVKNSANAAKALFEMSNNLPEKSNAVVAWITGENTLSKFADELSVFGPKLKTYSDSVRGLDTGLVVKSALASTALFKMAENLPDKKNVVDAWLTGENTLSKFAEELSVFGPKLKEYSDSVRGVDVGTVTASAFSARVLFEMANNLPAKKGDIVAWFTGENSLSKFAEELTVFGPKLKEYARSVTGLDARVVINSTLAASSLMEMAKNLPDKKGDIVAWMTGENTLSKFAEELAVFGPQLKKYGRSVTGLDADVVQNSANAAKSLFEMAENLPAKKNVVDAWLTGENTLSKFAEELTVFGPKLREYARSVSGLNSDVVVKSAIAANALSEMANNLPEKKNAVMTWLTGENTLAKFAEELAVFGPHLKEYEQSVTGLKSSIVITSANAAKALFEMAENLPAKKGDIDAWLTGENTLSKFAEELAAFGPQLKLYSDSVIGMSPGAVTSSSNAAKVLFEMAESLPNKKTPVDAWMTGENTLSQFAEELAVFGPNLKLYSDSIMGMSPGAVSSSASAAKVLFEMAENLPAKKGDIGVWLTGENTLSQFAEELAAFGPQLKAYSDSIMGMAPAAVASSANAAKALFEMAENLPVKKASLDAWLTGENTLTDFASELANFGPKLKLYSDSIMGMAPAAVTSSANAAKALFEMAENLPVKKTGVDAWLTGENTLSKFAEELAVFGPKLKLYSDSIMGMAPAAVTSSANAAKTLFEMAANLPEKGGMVSWFTGDISISKFADELALFGPKLKAYGESVTGLDSSVVINSANAARSLFEMAANLPDKKTGVDAWLTGENTLTKFANELSNFGPKLKLYSDSVIGLDSSLVINSANAAKALFEMAANLPGKKTGIDAWLTGENTLSKFANELSNFGPKLKLYSDSILGLDSKLVINSANAAKALFEMAANLPIKKSGVDAWLTGENTLSKFASELAVFGPQLKLYSDSVVGLDSKVVTNSATAAKSLFEMAEKLPIKKTGVDAWLTGENSLSEFAKELASFGPHLKSYGDSVKGLDSSVVTNSANAAKSLTELVNNLPKSGGLGSLFSGNKDIASFGTKLESFGQSISNYADSVKGINTVKLALVATEFKSLVDLAGIVNGLDTSGLSRFGSDITALGKAGIDGFIKAFTDSTFKVTETAKSMIQTFIDGANSKKEDLNTALYNIVSGARTNLDKDKVLFKAAGDSLAYEMILGIRGQTETSKTAMGDIASGLLSQLRDKYESFKTTGTTIMSRVISGIESKTSTLKSSFDTGIGNGLTKVKGFNSQFHSAGANLAIGFANGIKSKDYLAAAQAKAMAQAAINSARRTLDTHSPSKVFYKIGGFAGLGFVNALSDYASNARDAGAEIATSAKDGISSAISKISEIVEGDLNAQPSIKPVLDLTDIESGAGRISSLIGQSKAISISTGRQSVRTEAERAIQNGSSVTINNRGMMEGATFNVREENDIEKIAKALDTLTARRLKGAGYDI